MKKAELCPVCGEANKTLKVSQVYLESLSKEDLIVEKGKKTLRQILGQDDNVPYAGRFNTEFIKAFSPPSGKSLTIRQVNPDQVMAVLLLVSLFFLYNIYLQQEQAFLTSVIIFIALMVGYVVFRKAIFRKYQKTKMEAEQASERIKRSINYWMELYYCARDNIIYHPGKQVTIKLSELKEHLSKVR